MFRSIHHAKIMNREAGGHWFEPEAMRFFGTKIETELLHGRFFVTSDCYDEDRGFQRKFTVVGVTDDGKVRNPSGFHRFGTKEEAVGWLEIAVSRGLAAADAAHPCAPLIRAFQHDIDGMFPEASGTERRD